MQRPLIIATYCWTILAAIISARTEWLNVAAGSPLPRHDAGKWRESISTNEERWREYTSPHYNNGEPLRGELTPAQRSQMERDTATAQNSNRLRNWVSSAGLFQYLLIPIAIGHCLVVLARKPNRRQFFVLLPAVGLITLATASLIYRQYFSSLSI